jgi:hypothetical protein
MDGINIASRFKALISGGFLDGMMDTDQELIQTSQVTFDPGARLDTACSALIYADQDNRGLQYDR